MQDAVNRQWHSQGLVAHFFLNQKGDAAAVSPLSRTHTWEQQLASTHRATVPCSIYTNIVCCTKLETAVYGILFRLSLLFWALLHCSSSNSLNLFSFFFFFFFLEECTGIGAYLFQKANKLNKQASKQTKNTKSSLKWNLYIADTVDVGHQSTLAHFLAGADLTFSNLQGGITEKHRLQ